jgi:hypothetical protein
MTGAPNATRTRDLPLRRSFHDGRSTAAFLVGGGLVTFRLPLDVCGVRLVLARSWHGRTQLIRGLRPSLRVRPSLFGVGTQHRLRL